MNGDAEREWRPDFEVDARLTLSVLAVGRPDPCNRVAPDGSIWRTAWFGGRAATMRLVQDDGVIRCRAWGAGAGAMLETVPDLLGARDDPTTFEPRLPVLERAHRRHRGLRVPATGQVFDPLVQAIFHQKVNGSDAVRSWCELVRRHGTPAPGPPSFVAGLRLPLTPAQWLDVPVWDWRRAGVEPSAVSTVRLVASRASSLERAAAGSKEEAYRVLRSLPGVGRWTAAEVGHRALGDADALPVGDYHLAAVTGFVLAGGRTVTDEEAESWWEPWRPHRYRVWRLLELTPAAWPPRRGPRMSRPEHRHGY